MIFLRRILKKLFRDNSKFSVRVRIILYLILGLYIIYGSSYCIFSCYGGYRFSQSGSLRYSGGRGLSVSDIVEWSPQGCWYQENFRSITGKVVSRGNEWGYFYAPLIKLDRRFFHKTYTVKEFGALYYGENDEVEKGNPE